MLSKRSIEERMPENTSIEGLKAGPSFKQKNAQNGKGHT